MTTKGADSHFCFRSVLIADLPTIASTIRVQMDKKVTEANQIRLNYI